MALFILCYIQKLAGSQKDEFKNVALQPGFEALVSINA
jgi:hypothetical protein